MSDGTGTYYDEFVLTLSSATSGSSIRYTTDGSNPTSSVGTPYSGGINIDSSVTIKAIAYRSGCTDSAVVSEDYTMRVANPDFGVAEGIYITDQSVSITSTTSGVSIRYTTDGVTDPTPSSGTLYTGPVDVTSSSGITSTEIRAIAYRAGWVDSSVATAEYAIVKPGDKLLYTNGSTLYIANADGSEETGIFSGTLLRDPCITPSGSKIVFSYAQFGVNYDIYTILIDGSNLTRLTTDAGVDDEPAIYSSSGKIAFQSDRDGDYEIFIMDYDGSNLTQLTSNSIGDYDPSFSSDGSTIVYSASGAIHTMDANGSNDTEIFSELYMARNPRYSPDDSKICMQYQVSGAEIYIIDADGTNLTQVTDLGGWNDSPCFSPDGTRVVFHSDYVDDYDYDLYTIKTDGTDLQVVTSYGTDEMDATYAQ
jgi:Tol biopolymer transport system component